MTAHTNGTAPMTTEVITRDLPGDASATLVTVADADGVSSGVQLTVPDEPLTATQLLDLSDELRRLARALAELHA